MTVHCNLAKLCGDLSFGIIAHQSTNVPKLMVLQNGPYFLIGWDITRSTVFRSTFLWADTFFLDRWLNTTRVLRKTCPGPTNLARKFCFAHFSDMHCTRGGIWNGDILVADSEELENLDPSEIHSRRINAKEVLTLNMTITSFS